MINLELGISGHFNICPGPQNIEKNNCKYCYLIDTVYRMGYNNGWQAAHEVWEAE